MLTGKGSCRGLRRIMLRISGPSMRPRMKSALLSYTLEGPFGQLLDAPKIACSLQMFSASKPKVYARDKCSFRPVLGTLSVFIGLRHGLPAADASSFWTKPGSIWTTALCRAHPRMAEGLRKKRLRRLRHQSLGDIQFLDLRRPS